MQIYFDQYKLGLAVLLSFKFGRAITNHVGLHDAICSDCDHKRELHGVFVLLKAIVLHLHVTIEVID